MKDEPRVSKSVRKVDALCFILIALYVSALTSRVDSTETSLQLSENITHFVVCRRYTGVINKLDRHQVFGAYYLCI
jgi:hypothetical protein